MSERRYPLQPWPGPGPKPRVWDVDDAFSHSMRETYIQRREARKKAAREQARRRAKEQRERRWKESKEYRQLERDKEIGRLALNPFASGKMSIAMAGTGARPAGYERLSTLLVEADKDDARYPSLPDILAAEPGGEEDVCLRFGDPPADGKSRVIPYLAEYDNHKEVGVSTFSGKLTASGNYLINCQDAGLEELRAYAVKMASEDRPAFFCRGRCIKRRKNGEWILRSPTLEPVPGGAVIAIKGSPSRALEQWLSRRGVDLGEWVAQYG